MPRPSPRALDLLGLLARLGLAAVWLYSGGTKIADLNQSYVAVQAYDVLPAGLVGPVSVALPFTEIALGLLLLAGVGTRWVAALSAGLLLVFLAGITQAWARGLSIDCGCFGGGGQVAAGQTRYAQELLRDIGFLLLAGWLLLRPRTPGSVDRWMGADGEIENQREGGSGGQEPTEQGEFPEAPASTARRGQQARGQGEGPPRR